jgi:hypothetical protein
MESNVALIIIYNHNFEENIARCEAIYRSKFDCIFHLMPFYSGNRENVIPVYEHSYYFQGYVAQGFKIFFKEEFQHYIFIADDLILNPEINQNNYKIIFKLDDSSSYLSRFGSLPDGKQFWSNYVRALKYNPKPKGCEIMSIIPNAGSVSKRLLDYGVQNQPFSFHQVYGKLNPRTAFKYFRDKLCGLKLNRLNYPLAKSYSDIFVIDRFSIKNFTQLSGAFAATDLFVELAIPTAMIMSCNKIVIENQLEFQGKAMWTPDDFKILDQYESKLENLLKNFPRNFLYLHPIKLSKWL